MANAVTQIMYGIPVAKSEDHYAAVADQAFNAMTNAASPGTFLVDVFPICEHTRKLSTIIAERSLSDHSETRSCVASRSRFSAQSQGVEKAYTRNG